MPCRQGHLEDRREETGSRKAGIGGIERSALRGHWLRRWLLEDFLCNLVDWNLWIALDLERLL